MVRVLVLWPRASADARRQPATPAKATPAATPPACGGWFSVSDQPLVIDAYSGPGGVGFALDQLSVRHVGLDWNDYSDTYPGEFIRCDCSYVEFMSKLPSPALLWLSPRCQAYSTLSYANAGRYDWDQSPRERYPTLSDLNVRSVIEAIDPTHYIIENVKTCDDLHDPVRLNGFAFDLPIENQRHFETSFPAPDATEDGDPKTIVGSGYARHEIAEIKRIPASWTESEIRSAIPKEYVQYLLHYCPSTPGIPLPESVESKQTTLPHPDSGGGSQ